MHQNNDSKGLLAGMDVENLKTRIARPPYREYWESMARRRREVAAWEAETGRIVNLGCCNGGQVTWLVQEAALEHRLTGNRDALDYVSRQIDKLANIFLYHPETWKVMEHPYGGRSHHSWSEMHVCLAADLCRDGLDQRRRDDLLRMVREKFLEAPYVGWNARDRYLSGHNMAVTEQACAGICALVWGADAGRSDWDAVVQRAIESCALYCRYGLDRAGYGYEGTMYPFAPMYVTYLFAQLLCQNGRENLFELIPELKAYPAAIRNLLFPDRIGLTPIADGGILHPVSYAWLLLTARHYDRPEDLGLWYEYRGPGRKADPWPADIGEKGPVWRDGWGQYLLPFLWWDADRPMTPIEKSMDPTAVYSPGTEVAFFRTSWSPAAVYLNVNGQGRSHCALDHAHNDGGHFTIFSHGEYLAIDTGYGNILEDQHSVVLIDGQTQFNRVADDRYRWHYAGRIAEFQRHGMLDYARIDQAAPRNCLWADRHVLFVRLGGDDAYMVFLDNINPDHGKHTYQWQLQAHPESAVRITGARTAVVDKPKARLDITFLSPRPADFPGCPHELALRTDFVYGAYRMGSKSAEKGKPKREESEFAYTREEARESKADLTSSSWYRPRLVAEQTGPNCLMMSILSPRRAGAAPLVVKDLTGKRIFRADIHAGAFTDTVIAVLDHGLIQFPDVTGYAEVALIRRDPAGKVIGQWTPGASRIEVR